MIENNTMRGVMQILKQLPTITIGTYLLLLKAVEYIVT